MAYGEFYVERQYWARFPKVLIMCRKHGRMENGNCAVERMRYVPERTCEMVPLEPGVYATNAVRCSKCDAIVATFDDEYECCEIRFCPNCGCKVVGE